MHKHKLLFLIPLLTLFLSNIQPAAASTWTTHAAPHIARSHQQTMVTVDPNIQYQTIQGWGTSLAWWAEIVGQWSPSDRANLENLLFNPNAGLGLNLVRYNFGGVTSASSCPNTWRKGGAVPSFLPPNDTNYNDFNAANDQSQLNVLLDARSMGADTFEGFANSAPDWMLSNHCSQGDGGSDNLQQSHESDYANYLSIIAQHFQNDYSINFQTVDPFNEPDGKWWNKGGNQEGMYVDIPQRERVIQSVYSVLPTAISASDDNSVDNAVSDYNALDATSKGDISQLNTHTYNGTNLNGFYQIGQQTGNPIWMSEFTTNGTKSLGPQCVYTTNPSIKAMSGALALSCRILLDMNYMHPSAWVYWQAVEDHSGGNAYGLLQTPYSSQNHTITYTKQYYAMKQYTKYIRPGMQMIGVDSSNSLASYDQNGQKVVIVTMNDSNKSQNLTYDLSKFSITNGSVTPYRTSKSENFSQLSAISLNNNQFQYKAPSQSITTFVINGVTGINPQGSNLLSDPGFENDPNCQNLGPWTGQWHPNNAGVENNYPHSGLCDAYLHPTLSQDVGLYQNVTAPQTGTYTLSAYAATEIASGTDQIGADVNGTQATHVNVKANVGYQYYTFTFNATAGDTIKVWYYAKIGPDIKHGVNYAWATLDDVSLAFNH